MNDDLEQAYARCAAITRSRGPNFSVGFDVLPAPKRRAIQASYAFCRLVDDFVDEPGEGVDPRKLLRAWSDELAAAYRGEARHPVGKALADTVKRFPIARRSFDDLIRGCAEDLSFRIPHDVSATRRYCDLVATPIGEICLAVFGTVGPGARRKARHLSHAFQWTNMLRDVAEDQGRGRVYLPLVWWKEAGVPIDALLDPARECAVLGVLRRGVQLTRAHYLDAEGLVEIIGSDARTGLHLMVEVYREVLERIAADPARVLRERIELSLEEKHALVRAQASA